MLLVYTSRTGNIERIVEKLQIINKKKIETGDELINQNFVLLTYTDLLGKIPQEFIKFLSNNSSLLKAVAGSGNMNFGNNFCKSSVMISDKYSVPLLEKFELSGHNNQIINFKKKITSLGCY